MLKAIAFAVVCYFLIKFVSRFFLSPTNKKKSKAHAFYEVFKNVQQQSKNQQKRDSSSSNNNFEEIEEAEFEDVTNDEKASTKSSD